MRKLTTTLLSICLMACAVLHPAQAQSDSVPSDEGLRIATGKKGKGFSKLFADIQSVCGSKVVLTEVETEGGLQNLTMLAANEADLGFAQLDTLTDMKSTDEAIGKFLAVLPLNSNLLHIVARADGFALDGTKKWDAWMHGNKSVLTLESISDLKGLPVALVGSAQKLVRTLDRRWQLDLSPMDVETDEQGLGMLRRGEVAAVFSASGWPSGTISKLKKDSGMKLLAFDLPSQGIYQVVRKNYNNLGAYNVGFLAAPNLLVSRPFKSTGSYGKAVSALQACITKNLGNLQEGRYEAGWGEIKSLTETYNWPRFADAGKR